MAAVVPDDSIMLAPATKAAFASKSRRPVTDRHLSGMPIVSMLHNACKPLVWQELNVAMKSVYHERNAIEKYLCSKVCNGIIVGGEPSPLCAK